MKYLNLVLTVIVAALVLVALKVGQIGATFDRAQEANRQLTEAYKAMIASNAHLEETMLGLKEEINKTSDKFVNMTASSSDLDKTIAGLRDEISKVSGKIK